MPSRRPKTSSTLIETPKPGPDYLDVTTIGDRERKWMYVGQDLSTKPSQTTALEVDPKTGLMCSTNFVQEPPPKILDLASLPMVNLPDMVKDLEPGQFADYRKIIQTIHDHAVLGKPAPGTPMQTVTSEAAAQFLRDKRQMTDKDFKEQILGSWDPNAEEDVLILTSTERRGRELVQQKFGPALEKGRNLRFTYVTEAEDLRGRDVDRFNAIIDPWLQATGKSAEVLEALKARTHRRYEDFTNIGSTHVTVEREGGKTTAFPFTKIERVLNLVYVTTVHDINSSLQGKSVRVDTDGMGSGLYTRYGTVRYVRNSFFALEVLATEDKPKLVPKPAPRPKDPLIGADLDVDDLDLSSDLLQ